MPTPGELERDRDDDGRARNSRPRDRLGRPLPFGSIGVERIPDDLDLPPAESLTWAQDLLDQGLAFNAHEVLEGAWKSCPDEERMLWQGLAQLAVGVTHVQRGNPKGALSLFERAIRRIESHEGPVPYGIDAAGLVSYAQKAMADLRRGSELEPAQLAPRLVREPQ
ncbi:DUF309 domain-containing protein [Gordonia sp. HY002]|uniref:DUF309 domain-containing protein n=1 Tax=Gordonia zhenghanii TaxID=2911516 RepID=UPI001EF13CE7|nr:DUF309 domain-containing protein [Gordonia zhenghanii]MCF8569926.1 DUF309 domain-containing protein [Gordonia zhenghanii]MCF8605503.1 DUF309 domain-containing protein [Gordonia zhenghanii]